MLCNSMDASFLTQSWLITILPSFNEYQWVYDGPDLKLFILVGWDRSFLSVAWPIGVQLVFLLLLRILGKLLGAQGLHRRVAY